MIPTRHWLPVDAVLPHKEDGVSHETLYTRKLGFVAPWHAGARCRTVEKPDEMFFDGPEDQHRPAFTITQIKAVKAFCAECPVFRDCLTHALTTPERHGIWAGTSKRTRARILAMIEQRIVTVSQVVDDYMEGRGRIYETRRAS